jgi:hypothetical protein
MNCKFSFFHFDAKYLDKFHPKIADKFNSKTMYRQKFLCLVDNKVQIRWGRELGDFLGLGMSYKGFCESLLQIFRVEVGRAWFFWAGVRLKL